MTRLRSLFICEWKQTVEHPENQHRFAHFINSNKRDENVQFITERNQHRPASLQERYTVLEEQ